MLSNQNIHRTCLLIFVVILTATSCSSNEASNSKPQSQHVLDHTAFWKNVNLSAPYVRQDQVTMIEMVDDKSISPEIVSALKLQGEEQFGLFLSKDMFSNEGYAPTMKEFKEEYPAFFDYSSLLGKYNAFERFQQINGWAMPGDFVAFYEQYKITTSRAPFLQIPSRFLTYFGFKFNAENIHVKDYVITRSKKSDSLYNITVLVEGAKGRMHAIRNESCYYKKGRGCLTYLSWDYLGRVTDKTTGKLYTNAELWASEHFEK